MLKDINVYNISYSKDFIETQLKQSYLQQFTELYYTMYFMSLLDHFELNTLLRLSVVKPYYYYYYYYRELKVRCTPEKLFSLIIEIN